MQNTNPGKRNANTAPKACTVAVVTNQGANWGTMVRVGNRAYQVTAIAYNAQGNPVAYTVVTRASMVATIAATHAPGGTYIGYTANGQHYGACKLATAMGMVPGLNRYAQ